MHLATQLQNFALISSAIFHKSEFFSECIEFFFLKMNELINLKKKTHVKLKS